VWASRLRSENFVWRHVLHMGPSTGCRLPLAQAVAAAAVHCFGSTMGSFFMTGIDSAGNSAARDKGHTPYEIRVLSTRKNRKKIVKPGGKSRSRSWDQVGMVVFTTALGLYGGVLWSGELQAFILHEMAPSRAARGTRCSAAHHASRARGEGPHLPPPSHCTRPCGPTCRSGDPLEAPTPPYQLWTPV
jgi:hypothetical protein